MTVRILVRSLLAAAALTAAPSGAPAAVPAAPAVAAGPAAEVAAAAVRPRYAFLAGQAWRYSVVVNHDTRFPGPDGRDGFALTSTATFDAAWTVRAVAADGSATVDVAVERFAYAAKGPGFGAIDVGSGKAPPAGQNPAAAVYDVLDATRRGTVVVTVTADGRVTAFRWPAPAGKAFAGTTAAELAGFFGDAFTEAGARRYLTMPVLPLPAGPVAPGDGWAASAPAYGLDGRDAYRATAVGGPAGTLTCGIAATIGRAEDGPGRAATGGGTAAFDLAGGRLASLDRQFDLPAGPAGGRATARVTVRLLADRPPQP